MNHIKFNCYQDNLTYTGDMMVIDRIFLISKKLNIQTEIMNNSIKIYYPSIDFLYALSLLFDYSIY